MQVNKAIFLDKDGTLIPDIPYNVDPDLIQLEEGVLEGLKLLKKLGYHLVVVTNQAGIAKGFFEEEAIGSVRDRLFALLQDEGQTMIDGFYYCPHHPYGSVDRYTRSCLCRKPLPGLLYRAERDFQLSLKDSWMIGDILNDVEAGNRAGCRSVLLNKGNETEWLLGRYRKPFFMAPNFLEAVNEIANHTNTVDDGYRNFKFDQRI